MVISARDSRMKANIFYLLLVFARFICTSQAEEDPLDSLLSSYKNSRDLSARRLNFDHHRHVRDCQPIVYGNTTFEVHSPASRASKKSKNTYQLKYFSKKISTENGDRFVNGHLTSITNPLQSLSVLEPLRSGGCGGNLTSTVAMTSKQMKCHLAVNAGFFNTHTRSCLGNIVSGGELVRDSKGIQNANFGILKNGSLVVGYLSEQDVTAGIEKEEFYQLVTGVVWILRNGELYVDESIKAECQDTEETGTIKMFANVVSARTAVGYDKKGRAMIVQIDGKTHHQGLNLYDFGRLLQSFGLVNAINLDGGGSATFVVNGSVVNYPSDKCEQFNCARKVSTILCVHDKLCNPPDCNGNGECSRDGVCVCRSPWTGSGCSQRNDSKMPVIQRQMVFCNKSMAGNCSTYGNVTTREVIKRFLIRNYAWIDVLLIFSVLVNFIMLFVLFCGQSSKKKAAVPRKTTRLKGEDTVNLLEESDEI